MYSGVSTMSPVIPKLDLSDQEAQEIEVIAKRVCATIDRELWLDHPLEEEESTLCLIVATLVYYELRKKPFNQ